MMPDDSAYGWEGVEAREADDGYNESDAWYGQGTPRQPWRPEGQPSLRERVDARLRARHA